MFDNKDAGMVWDALLHSSNVSIFWKDTNRRFIGANAKFLETYGIRDVSEIIGKTDEDMRWHIDDEPFRQDELEVLNQERAIVSRIGKCIIKGVMRNILALKEPMYQDGKLMGLVGTFIDLDGLENYLDGAGGSPEIDSITGVMSTDGISETSLDFIEAWDLRKDQFAVIILKFGIYRKAEQILGEAAAQKILKDMARLLKDATSKNVVIGRVNNDSFVLLSKYETRAEIEHTVQDIEEACARGLDEDGKKILLQPIVKVSYSEDSEDVYSMLKYASNGFFDLSPRQKELKMELYNKHIKLKEIVDALPGGFSLFDYYEGTGRLVYASEGLNKDTGYTSGEYQALMTPEHLYDVVPEDSERVKRAMHNALYNGESYDITYRMNHADGHPVWLKAQGKVVSERSGHKYFMTYFSNLWESAQLLLRITGAMKEGLIVSELDSHDILYANPAARKLRQDMEMEDLGSMLDIFKEAIGDCGECEQQFGNRYLSVNIIQGEWQGHAADICFIVDQTQQYHGNALAREILSHVPSGIAVFAITDQKEVHRLYLSDQARVYCHIGTTGASSLEELLQIVHVDDRDYVRDAVQESIDERQDMTIEFRVYGDDGKIYWNQLKTSPYIQEDGSYYLYGVYSDITELKLRTEELQERSCKDGFTKLYNRATGEYMIEKSLNAGDHGMFCLLDVDEFKHFNDAYGHAAGDKILLELSKCMTSSFRSDDVLVRLGGDEFVIYAPHIRDYAAAQECMKRFVKNVAALKFDEFEEKISVSEGMVFCNPGEYLSFDEVYRDADALMYENKGRKKVDRLTRQKASLMDNIPGGVHRCTMDDKAHVIFVNQGFTAITGYTLEMLEDEFDGLYEGICYDQEDVMAFEAGIKKLQAGEAWADVSYRIRHKDGHMVWLKEQIAERVGENGEREAVAVIMDVTGEKDTFASVKDPLTDLLEVGSFYKLAQLAIETLTQIDAQQILYFNIRNFKSYNMKYGMELGNKVLTDVADMISGQFSNELVCRVGEDHYLVLTEADDVLKRLDAITETFNILYSKERLNIKTGIYRLRDEDRTESIVAICDKAIIACDFIKNSKKRSACYFDDDMLVQNELSEYVVHEIDKAIENDWIEVYYQPNVRTLSGEVCGFEALARWIDPIKGFLAPYQFIPALEESGDIFKLDVCVIHAVCKRLALERKLKHRVLPISFNISRMDLLKGDIFSEIEAARKEYQIPVDLLHVEITESCLIGDKLGAENFIAKLHAVGYQVWMDDFGSGYANFSLLSNYEFDLVKLDMSFLEDDSEERKTLIRNVIHLSKEAGLFTLTEGVETKAQYEFLRTIGCEIAQGYYFGKPLPYEDAIANCQEKGLVFEDKNNCEFYGALGRVDLIEDRCLALVEFIDNGFKYVYMNDRYKEILLGAGRVNMSDINDKIGSSFAAKQLLRFQEGFPDDHKPHEYDYVIGNNTIRFRFQRIIDQNGRYGYTSEGFNITRKETNLDKLDEIMRYTTTMYDAIYLVDVDSNNVQPLFHGSGYGHKSISEEEKTIEESIQEAIAGMIHPDDRDAYLRWSDIKRVRERISRYNRSFIYSKFRTKEANDNYVQKIHRIMSFPNTTEEKYLYTIAISESSEENW